MRRTPRVHGKFIARPLALALAAAALLGAALPARADDFYSFSGSVGTFPFDFFPIDPTVSFYDMSGNTLFVGTSAFGSFSAFGGALLKVDAMTIGNGGTGSGSVSVAGPTTLVELGGTGTRLQVGSWGSATMEVSAGALVDATVNAAACGSACWNVVGSAAGSTGTLTVTGAGSELRALRFFAVGQAYVDTGFGAPGGTTTAFLNVLDGGALRTENALVSLGGAGPGATGAERTVAAVAVSGPGSQWIVTRNSIDGGTAYFAAGTQANAEATINITGGGKLIIDGTGTVNDYDGVNLGLNGGRADLTVSGVGSAVEVSAPNAFIQVGRSGANPLGSSFNVLAGGSASAKYMSIGRDGATGTLNVDGAGSRVTLSGVGEPGFDGAAGLVIGRSGQGFANVSGGALLRVTDGGADTRPGGDGPYIVVGGEANASGSLDISGSGSKVEIISTAIVGLPAGAADNYNPYMSLGYDTTSAGFLSVRNGGELVLQGNAVTSVGNERYTSLVIGGRNETDFGGAGTALITGPGSKVQVQGTDANVGVGRGPGSTGTLRIEDQGHLESTGLVVGQAGGTGSLTLDNATVRLSGGPFVDGSGAGLTIGAGTGSLGVVVMSNGSKISLSSDTAPFGINVGGGRTLAGGQGVLSLDSGSMIEYSGTAAHALSVGRSVGGAGTVLVTGGSSIVLGSNGSVYLGRVAGASGTLFLGGSTLSADYVGVGSTPGGVDTGFGQLLVSGSTLSAATVEVGANGYLGGSQGTLNGLVKLRGVLAPGESRGRVIINGGIEVENNGRILLEVESDGNGGFETDQVILTPSSSFAFGETTVIFSFLGDTDPNAFGDSGGFAMDTFLRSGDFELNNGLSSVFEVGATWGSVLAEASFTAQSEQFDITDLTFNPADGTFGVVAVPVPEPSTWLLMFAGIALLLTRALARGARR